MDCHQKWRVWTGPVDKPGILQGLLQQDIEIIRVCDLGAQSVVILAKDGKLYTKTIGNKGDDCQEFKLVLSQCFKANRILDICAFQGLASNQESLVEQGLIVILDSGQAYHVDMATESIVASIVHNAEFSTGCADFKKCVAGPNHLILVDSEGQAWSIGGGPQTGRVHEIKSDRLSEEVEGEPIKILVNRIDFFEGVKIIAISSGKDFNLALVERFEERSSDSKSGQNRSSCPLGLPIAEMRRKPKDQILENDQVELRKKNLHRSMAVVDMLTKNEDISINNTDQESREDKTESQVERLARSGIYINPSDAIRFLSDQLSWIGKGVVVEGDEQQRRLSSKVEESSVAGEKTEDEKLEKPSEAPVVTAEPLKPSLASTFVSDGIRAVGNTVSKLSRSFSIVPEHEPKEVDLILSDINVIDTDETPAVSPSDDRPPSPLPMTTRKNFGKSNSLKRSSTYIPPGDLTRSATIPHGTLTRSHRRSQSATFLSKLNDLPVQIGSKPNSNLVRPKPTLFDTEVWFWGKGRRGQCGQGDMLDRLQPAVISSLSKLGVQKVVCGKSHCLSLMLTGTVYGWGDNTMGQSCPQMALAVCSIPHAISLPVGETGVDIAATENFSFVLTDAGNIYKFGANDKNKRSSFVQKIGQQELDIDDDKSPRKILACSQGLFGSVSDIFLPLANFKSIEKMFLRKVCDIESKILDPLLGKCDENGKDPYAKNKTKILSSIRQIIEIVSMSVSSSWQMFTAENCCMLTMLSDASLGTALETYTKQVCDCLVVDCLHVESSSPLVSTMTDLLENLCHINSVEGKNPLQLLLLDPTSQLQHYIFCLQAMVMAGRQLKQTSILRTCESIEASIQTLKNVHRDIEKEKHLTRRTCEFWEMAGTKLAALKIPTRRILLDSRISIISVANATSFSKHWIILMNDILVHAGYSTYTVHPLQTIWIDSHQNQGNSGTETEGKFEIALIMPEETLTLSTPSAEAKMEWFANLQRGIIMSLVNGADRPGTKTMSVTPPITRTTSFVFKKIPELRGAEYQGTWMHGKLHGHGTLKWPDGRIYVGQLRQNQKHGIGRMEVVEHTNSKVNLTVFEGQWKCDKFDGNGTIIYASGDVYKGSVKDGKPHGQGVLKQGKFMGTGASVYLGEWNNGLRHGYGVLDDIVSGEKYMGMWSQDMKSGPGCVVTLDGVYYEGTFSHGKMTGKGLMMFEDETVYEGYFADAGVFSGHGILTYCNGDHLDGSFYGNYSDGMKFNGTVYKTVRSPISGLLQTESPFGQDKIGTYSVEASQKWSSVFAYYEEILGIPDHRGHSCLISEENPQASWEHLAIHINQNKNAANMAYLHQQREPQNEEFNTSMNSSIMVSSSRPGIDVLDGLEMIPDYHSVELTLTYFQEVIQYLSKAFSSPLHPLSTLLTVLCDCFAATYGGVRVHPRLLKHAVEELNMMVAGLYHIVHCLFPTLPPLNSTVWLEDDSEADESLRKGEAVSASSIIYPYLLPKIYASIFMLYALHYKKEDDDYWARIYKWNRHPDIALLSFLEVDEKFWIIEAETSSRKSFSQVRDRHFVEAIETLQQIKTTFTPFEKLNVLLETFRQINKTVDNYNWSMDELFPVFQYIVVRARILQLGAEIHMIEDLTQDDCLRNGEFGIMFTTLQASYYQILRESLSMY